jgi:hypothetical protein
MNESTTAGILAELAHANPRMVTDQSAVRYRSSVIGARH